MADIMRRGEHIWLRQSATFAVDGQTRMVEIAIPLRPGASAEAIEALLRQADAGLAQLRRAPAAPPVQEGGEGRAALHAGPGEGASERPLALGRPLPRSARDAAPPVAARGRGGASAPAHPGHRRPAGVTTAARCATL